MKEKGNPQRLLIFEIGKAEDSNPRYGHDLVL
jgi:hypothetical protein